MSGIQKISSETNSHNPGYKKYHRNILKLSMRAFPGEKIMCQWTSEIVKKEQ